MWGQRRRIGGMTMCNFVAVESLPVSPAAATGDSAGNMRGGASSGGSANAGSGKGGGASLSSALRNSSLSRGSSSRWTPKSAEQCSQQVGRDRESASFSEPTKFN